MKKKILFLCTGNSCRSQMAEGWCRKLWPDLFECYSAGVEKHNLNPNAVSVMRQLGVDISNHYSKLVEELPMKDFDYVITVCDNANQSCPVFHGETRIIHVGFDDPPALAVSCKTENEVAQVYVRVAKEIYQFVKDIKKIIKD